jgi:hypothetical protein
MSSSPDAILCPICKKPVTGPNDPASPNPFFPFCSDRCKLIDLGRWLDGKYQIPVSETPSAEKRGEDGGGKSG